jgi:hypothetical protein
VIDVSGDCIIDDIESNRKKAKKQNKSKKKKKLGKSRKPKINKSNKIDETANNISMHQ